MIARNKKWPLRERSGRRSSLWRERSRKRNKRIANARIRLSLRISGGSVRYVLRKLKSSRNLNSRLLPCPMQSLPVRLPCTRSLEKRATEVMKTI